MDFAMLLVGEPVCCTTYVITAMIGSRPSRVTALELGGS